MRVSMTRLTLQKLLQDIDFVREYIAVAIRFGNIEVLRELEAIAGSIPGKIMSEASPFLMIVGMETYLLKKSSR